MSNKKQNFSWLQLLNALWFFLDGHRKRFILWNILLFIVNLYSLIPALIIGLIVDFFVDYQKGLAPLTRFYYYVAILSVTYILAAIIRLSVKRRFAKLSFDVRYSVRVKAFQFLINRSLAWHQEENSGNKVQRVDTGAMALRSLIKLFENGIYDILSTYVGVIIVLAFVNLKFSLFIALYLAIFLVIQSSFYSKQRETINKLNRIREKASGKYYESLNNVLAIKSLGVNKSFEEYINNNEDNVRQTGHEESRIMNNKWRAFQIFNGIAILVFLLLVGESVIAGAVTIGSIVILFNYFQKFSGASGDATHKFDDLVEIKEEVGRMMPLFVGSRERPRYKSFPKRWNYIKIANARFSYSKVADSFSLFCKQIDIKRGSHVGIIGESGSGKSTFVKIFLGLYNFDKGIFRIGKADFNDVTRDDISKHISIVLQESELFNMSLKDNITLLKDYDEEMFNKVIEISQLEAVIKKLPNGPETIIGERGYRLSGGERQRIGIARALYKNPDIILFDEATSNLDEKTQSAIIRAIKNGLQDKTLITVAHRLAVVREADCLYVFNHGEIVESGGYDDLIKNLKSLVHNFDKKA
jgi:ABC-type multidrug transport system fused ATPase/permease subunit